MNAKDWHGEHGWPVSISSLIVLLAAVLCVSAPVLGFQGGTGRPCDPYQIANAKQLLRIALFNPGQYADRLRVPTLLIDAEKEHYFKIKDNSGRVHEILKKNGVPTEYHVLKGIKHYDVYSGQALDDVMKIEISWFDKYLKGDK